MKAVVYNGSLTCVEDHPLPVPGEGEALIRIGLAGICNTDLEIMKGYQGFQGVLGHEFVGIVEKINCADKRLLDKRVVGEINIHCGRCEYCINGFKNHCCERSVVGILHKDGAMAEYITLPIESLHEVPATVSDEAAVFTEPLAAAFDITRQIQIRPSNNILVLGDGKLGLLITYVLKLTNATIILAGKHKDKLRLVEEQNITTALVNDLTNDRKYDIVVDATGSGHGLDMALRFVKPMGTVVLKTTVSEHTSLDLTKVIVDEITIVGSRCGPFQPALNALSRGLIDVKPLITGILPFNRTTEAFALAQAPDSLKVIIDFRL